MFFCSSLQDRVKNFCMSISNSNRFHIAVLQGGPSSEAEVSRVSAAGVSQALRNNGHHVVQLECDSTLLTTLSNANVDVVFPVVHGALGEDGAVQGLLEIVRLPYVGADVLASALANDKIRSKQLFRQAGLPVAKDMTCLRNQFSLEELSKQIIDHLGSSIVVKPSRQGSALGVTRLRDLRDAQDPRLHQAFEKAFQYDEAVLVEQFVDGREITCGVLDLYNTSIRALPPTEIRSKFADWYDFRSRYAPGGSEHLCPAPLEPSLLNQVQQIAIRAHQVLGVRDVSRADFVVGHEGQIVLLEVNTMPGMTPTSLYPEAAAIAGIPFDLLCERLVQLAYTRGVRTFAPVESFPNT